MGQTNEWRVGGFAGAATVEASQSIDVTSTGAHRTWARKLIREHWNGATATFTANKTRAYGTLTPMRVRYTK